MEQSFQEIHCITFDYGQKHSVEIEAAKKIVAMAGPRVKSHEIIKIGDDVLAGTSPLTNPDEELEQYDSHDVLPGGLEKTFVPMRNLLFLTIAANRAYCLGAANLVTGVCQEDFGGYPDCRRVFIDSMEATAKLAGFTSEDGAPGKLVIHTPLMYLTKGDSVEFALRLNGCYSALAYSHTSYDGAYPPEGHDHATLLRAKGFEHADVPDPLVLRAFAEGVMALPDTPNYSEDHVKWGIDRAGISKLDKTVPQLKVHDTQTGRTKQAAKKGKK
jgi:7-cyano-7-deazaguanine synthase